jgi:hypothetical protein
MWDTRDNQVTPVEVFALSDFKKFIWLWGYVQHINQHVQHINQGVVGRLSSIVCAFGQAESDRLLEYEKDA